MIFILSFSTLLIGLYGFMIATFWLGWKKRHAIVPDSGSPNQFVSVIVPFRNEEQNLNLLLENLSHQSYPIDQFEVILINDHSSDGSVEVVESFVAQSSLNLVLINSNGSGKKKAIETGVTNSRGKIIFQTDADCQIQERWMESLADTFSTTTGLVLGPVNMNPSNGFWSAFAALDFMSLQASGAALTLLGKPIMGSAANMGYTKQLWEQAKKTDTSRESGDDVFLIQEVKRVNAGVAINMNPKCIVQTEAPESFGAMIEQRSRWGAKTPSYSSALAKSIALLVAFYSIWCLVLLGFGIFSKPALQLFIFTLGVKAALDYYFLKSYSKATKQQSLMKIFPSASLVYPFYIVITIATMAFSKQTWKGRTIR